MIRILACLCACALFVGVLVSRQNSDAEEIRSIREYFELESSESADAPPVAMGSSPPPAQIITQAPRLDAKQLALRDKVRAVLAHYENKRLNSRDHTPWEVMHALIAYGVKTDIHRGGPGGPRVNAIGWLCWDGRCKGDALLTLSRYGVEGRVGPGVQGHPGQFLGMLAQSHVKADYPMQIGGRSFTVADLIASEQDDCRPNTELTFKLIALSHYLKHDAIWKSRDGQQWSIPRLIQEEIKQPIRGAACGGTHRLFGLSYAYISHMNRGEPVEGEYARAKAYIADYHRYTFGSLQNSDGSFSTEWFTRPGARPDLDRRLQTSGHILEWLAFSVPDEALHQPNMTRAVDYLATLLQQYPTRDWAIGPLGHAIHALVMYDERAFGPASGSEMNVAQGRSESSNDSTKSPKTSSSRRTSTERVDVEPQPVEVGELEGPALLMR